MSYQMSVTRLSEVKAEQLHHLLLRYCQRMRFDPDSVVSQADLLAASQPLGDGGFAGLQVCGLNKLQSGQLEGAVLFHPGYSSWVGAHLKLGAVHCESQLSASLMRSVVARALDNEEMQRIELLHPLCDSGVYSQLLQLGFTDVTKSEAWHFASLDEAGLRGLSDRLLGDSAAAAKVRVRLATEDDCDDVMTMIYELAEFENMRYEVLLSTEQLRRDTFGSDRRLCRLLVAADQEDGQLVGFAMVFDEFWHCGRGLRLEDVFVKPERRGRGICSLLFASAAAEALSRGCRFMSLCFLDWNTTAFDIYRRYGFRDITESQSMHCLRLERSQFRVALSL